MKVFSLLWVYDDFFHCVFFLQSFRRKQLPWVVRSQTGPNTTSCPSLDRAHLHSEHFRPNFTYTIQSLYYFISINLVLLHLCLFCVHPAEIHEVPAETCLVFLSCKQFHRLNSNSRRCYKSKRCHSCCHIFLSDGSCTLMFGNRSHAQQRWPHQFHQPSIPVITIHSHIGCCKHQHGGSIHDEYCFWHSQNPWSIPANLYKELMSHLVSQFLLWTAQAISLVLPCPVESLKW